MTIIPAHVIVSNRVHLGENIARCLAMCANAGMHLEIGDQRHDSQPGLSKSSSEVNCSCTHPYIRAVIVLPAIGMFIEAAGDTDELDPDVLGCTVNSCEK